MKTSINGFEKYQGKAKMLLVDVPQELHEANEAKNRLDIQITFKYLDADETKQTLDGLDAEVLEIFEKGSRNDKYTYLLDATRLGYDPETDSDKAVLKEIKNKLEGKEGVFTTYIGQINALVEGTKYAKLSENRVTTAVHNDRKHRQRRGAKQP